LAIDVSLEKLRVERMGSDFGSGCTGNLLFRSSSLNLSHHGSGIGHHRRHRTGQQPVGSKQRYPVAKTGNRRREGVGVIVDQIVIHWVVSSSRMEAIEFIHRRDSEREREREREREKEEEKGVVGVRVLGKCKF
jgi:hypothetical protein